MSKIDDHRISRLPDHLPGSDHVPHHLAAPDTKKTEKTDRHPDATPNPKKKEKIFKAARQGQHPDGVQKRPPSGRETRPSNRLQQFILKPPRGESADGHMSAAAQDQDQDQAARLSSPWQTFERVFDFRLGSEYDVAVALRKDSPHDTVIVRKVTIARSEDKKHTQEILDLACGFKHQNIACFVEPYGFSISADSYYTITEFCEGSIADFMNCTAWLWECHIATVLRQINDGVEFLAKRRLYVRSQNLENAWVTLDGDVKIAGQEDWTFIPVFNDKHRERYLEAFSSIAIELMSKIKVKAEEDPEKILVKCEKAYPNCVGLVRRMRTVPSLKIEGIDQIYHYHHSQKSELASDQHMLKNQTFFGQAEEGRKALRWVVLFSNMTAWKPWAYGRNETL